MSPSGQLPSGHLPSAALTLAAPNAPELEISLASAPMDAARRQPAEPPTRAQTPRRTASVPAQLAPPTYARRGRIAQPGSNRPTCWESINGSARLRRGDCADGSVSEADGLDPANERVRRLGVSGSCRKSAETVLRELNPSRAGKAFHLAPCATRASER